MTRIVHGPIPWHTMPNKWWNAWCSMWLYITDDYERKVNVAPEPNESGFYWIRTRSSGVWSVAEYSAKEMLWYTLGGDYGNTTIDEGIREWHGPLVPPS